MKMERNCDDEKMVDSNSIENKVQKEYEEDDEQQTEKEKEKEEEEEEDEDEDEALSLCDLPINEENQTREQDNKTDQVMEPQEDFNFGQWGDSAVTEPEMCVADEVFFQGQILPLRHSVSSETCLTGLRTTSQNLSRSVSMSEPNSDASTTTSSRSSSIRSHNSSSSSSSLTTKPYKPKAIRNQFHSHPSPSPQIRFSSFRHGNVNNNHSQKSTIWSLFRVGLVQTPEMALAIQDLKVRSFNSTNSSANSSFSISNNKKNKSKITEEDNKKKKKQWLFGGCKCTVDSVETVNISVRTPMIKIGNVAKESQSKEEQVVKQKTRQQQQQQGKQAMSRNRTFEWLKQLSLENAADESKDSRRHCTHA